MIFNDRKMLDDKGTTLNSVVAPLITNMSAITCDLSINFMPTISRKPRSLKVMKM